MSERICSITRSPFSVSPAEEEFCRSRDIPLPTLCPDFRKQQLLIFRNRSHLYHATCALTGKKIISGIPPDSGFPIYDVEAWAAGAWDGRKIGRPYDFSRPFFSQLEELVRQPPLPNRAVVQSTMENSDYTHGMTWAKNCYLVFAGSKIEDCLYSRNIVSSRSCVSCMLTTQSELCYQCTDITECYNVKYSEGCHSCSDSCFLFNCTGCRNCYGCVGLTHKEFCFYNAQLSRSEYEKRISLLDLGSRTIRDAEFRKHLEFRTQFPRKYCSGRKNEGSSGNFLNNTARCNETYYCNDGEDLEHCIWLMGPAKNSFFHCSYGSNSELIYNSVTCGDSVFNVLFSVDCWPGCRDLEYCFYVNFGSHDCFGCAGLSKKSYCILNKQYSKEEYFELLPRVKAHMKLTGEYGTPMPHSFSPFAYNGSEANDYYPLTKAQILQRGFKWKEDEVEFSEVKSTPEVPDNIRDVSDDALGLTFHCTKTKRPYKIVKAELEFHRSQEVPLPVIAPMTRIQEMSDILHIRPLRNESCTNCKDSFLTSYDSSRSKLLCERCYQDFIV